MCNGDIVPDGSPCNMTGCSGTPSCVSGSCVCIQNAGQGGDMTGASATDMGGGSKRRASGCSVALGGDATGSMVVLLLALWLCSRRRRLSVS
jgi:hypothetical protein